MSTPIVSSEPWPVAGAENAGGRLAAGARRDVQPAGGTRPFHRMMGLLEDAGLLLLAALLFPVIILLIGMPIALLVRAVIEIARLF